MSAGATGVTLYYLIENVASNVGLFSDMAPILTAILSNFFIKHEAFSKKLLYKDLRHNQKNNKSICQTIFHHTASAKCHNRLAMMSLCFLA